MLKRVLLTIWFLIVAATTSAALPVLNPPKVVNKIHEILKSHAQHKELTSELMKRILVTYIEVLDPNKTYFIKSDIQEYLSPKDDALNEILSDYADGNFQVFFVIHDKMIEAIERRKSLDQKVKLENLPKKVKAAEFKDLDWVNSEEELLTRLERIKALQIETSVKLNEELKEKALQRIDKHQHKLEEEILDNTSSHREQFVLSNILKATASALDAHTAYFTPGEASQFMINVQQRLFGIGAQLRDDLNGFTVVKIIEGGPAALGKELKVKDRIVAVDGEPVVGMDIVNAVELIRGKEGTSVRLSVMRESENDGDKNEKQIDVTITRKEVVLKESRYETSYEPFGDGVIGYLRLYSFYQDPEFSSTTDLAQQISNLKNEHNLKGLILDLRYNSGGMLTQAVGVTGLFIKKGIVVGIKDNTGALQYLRDLDGKILWDGPLVVLINKASASASEIVAQTLQDYGRALIVGDENTYGKGSFQTFTLNTTGAEGTVNPEGEYKVTRGRYYTVSGKTPQLTGVKADIVLPGPLSLMDIGEKYSKFPLENDSIKENYDDDLSDIPFSQRQRVKTLYKYDLQTRLHTYTPYMETLKKNASYRIDHNKNYQTFLKELNKDDNLEAVESEEQFGQNDLQLTEAYNVMKDLIMLMQQQES